MVVATRAGRSGSGGEGTGNTAVVVTRPGEHFLVEQPALPLNSDDALVRVDSNGICRSDSDILLGLRPQGHVRYPLTPGHEWSGTVERVGSAVPQELLGRKVVGESARGCQICERCRLGENTLCESGYEETGFTQPGGMAQTLVVPARHLHTLPDDADLAAAAVLEPAARAVQAVLTADVRPHESVAVLGDGTLGLLVVQLLAVTGAKQVTVVGAGAVRGELALSLGATDYVTAEEQLPRESDVTIHTADSLTSARQTLGTLRGGGRLIVTSTSPSPDLLHPGELVRRQLDVQGVLGATSAAWMSAVRAFVEGRLDTSSLITHTFGLHAYQEAMDLMGSGDPAVGKVLLRPNGQAGTRPGGSQP